MSHAIAFIDASLPDHQSLVDSMGLAGIEIVIVDPFSDGIRVMAETLAGRVDIDAVHVLGHGSAGSATLGSTVLSQETLSAQADALGVIGRSLTADGDLLFYACDLAAGEAGQALLAGIAALTGADVAASDDLTGAATLGGDWVLEASVGQVEAEAVTVADYGFSLAEIAAETLTYTQVAETGKTLIFEDGDFNIGSGNILTGDKLLSITAPDGIVPQIWVTTLTKFVKITEGFVFRDNSPSDTDPSTGSTFYLYALEVNWDVLSTGSYPVEFTVKRGSDVLKHSFTVTVTKDGINSNTAPTISGSTVNVEEGALGQIDLHAAASDKESPDASLTFTKQSGAGTVSGQYLQYTPAIDAAKKGSGYADETTVISVSDGKKTAEATFSWNVNYKDDAPTGTISQISGVSAVGEVLGTVNTISDIDDGGANVSKSYQWQAYNVLTHSWGAISGATGSTFTPAAEHANLLVRVEITAGSPVQTFTSTEIRLIAPTEGPAMISLAGLPAALTVVRPSGDVTITNSNPLKGSAITLDGSAAGSTMTAQGNGPVVISTPGSAVTVSNEGTGIVTVTGVAGGNTLTVEGSGPIIVESAASTGITIDNAGPAGDLTLKNTGTGLVTVTPMGAETAPDVTIKIAFGSSGPIALDNPAGDVTVTHGGTGAVALKGLAAEAMVTSNGIGTGVVTVVSPAGDLTLSNQTGASTLTASGVADGALVTVSGGKGAISIVDPVGNVTVDNGTLGISTVSGAVDGSTVTAKGTGAVVVSSQLSAPASITVDATDNQSKVTADNDGSGTLVVTNLLTGAVLTSTGRGSGDTTVNSPTGSITIANTGTSTVTVSGFDTDATLTATGSGPVVVASPEGSGTISNTGDGLVTVEGVGDDQVFGTDGSGATLFSSPLADLTINNTGKGKVMVEAMVDGTTLNTEGSQPVIIVSPAGSLTVINTGTGLDFITELRDGKTVTASGSGNTVVSQPAGSLTLDNAGTGKLVADGAPKLAVVTTTGSTATFISNPASDVTVNNTGTGVATVTGAVHASTVSTQGAGPIIVNSVLASPSAITVAAGVNTDITLDNDGSGLITVTGVITGSTIKSTGDGSGITDIRDPSGTGTLTVGNTGNGTLTVTGLDSTATLSNLASSTGPITLVRPDSGTVTVNNQSDVSTVTVTGAPAGLVINGTGTGVTDVNDPLANVTLHNTGTGELKVSAANSGATVYTTGPSATTIDRPDLHVTVDNSGTGVATVTGAVHGAIVTTKGTGDITVNSVLALGSKVTVNAAANTNLTIDNDGTGELVVTGLPDGSTVDSKGSGSGRTTIENPVGNLTVNNTGSNVVSVTGFDSNRKLVTPGDGPISVINPDGNLFLDNTGTGLVTVTGINVGNSITTTGSGPVTVSAPDGNVNVVNNGLGLVTVSSVKDSSTVYSNGSGMQRIDLDGLTKGASVTIDNDGTGEVDLANVPQGVTIFFTGTGPTLITSVSGDSLNGPVVLENLASSLVTLVGNAELATGASLATSGSGPVSIDADLAQDVVLTVNIAGNPKVSFDNDGTGMLVVTGVPDDVTVTGTGSGPMTVRSPSGDLTVNNAGVGTLTVSGISAGKTLVTEGTGPVVVESSLSVGEAITVIPTANGNIRLVEQGAGQIHVRGDLQMTADHAISLSLNADDTTLIDLDGSLGITGGELVLNLAEGYRPEEGDQIILIDNDGTDAVTGTFEGMDEGARIQAGEHRFVLTYAGGDGNDIALTALAMQPLAPVITSNTGALATMIEVRENSHAVTTVVATDRNGDTPVYAITGGADRDAFVIDAVTGALSFVRRPDFEAPADTDRNNRYEVEVTAADGTGLSDVQMLSVSVTNRADNGEGVRMGTLRADTLRGLSGSDLLIGLGSTDTFSGGAGDDWLVGGLSLDKYLWSGRLGSGDLMAGGVDHLVDGNAQLAFSHEALAQILVGGVALTAHSSRTLAIGSSIDARNSIAVTGGEVRIDLNRDGLFNISDDFRIELYGNALGLSFDSRTDLFSLVATKTVRAPVMVGGNDDDTLVGNGLANQLTGSAGDDRLYGAAGNDRLTGGVGNDTLIGGTEADIYVWASADVEAGGQDMVMDDRGSRLQLDDQLLLSLTLGGVALEDLTRNKVLGNTIDDANGIAFRDRQILIDRDGNGLFEAAHDFSIQIVGNATSVQFDARSELLILA